MPRKNPQALLQNLQDAGCGEGLIAQFLTLYQAGQYPQSLGPAGPAPAHASAALP